MNTTWWGQTTHQLKDSHFVPHYHLESFDQEKADGKTLSKEEKYIFKFCSTWWIKRKSILF